MVNYNWSLIMSDDVEEWCHVDVCNFVYFLDDKLYSVTEKLLGETAFVCFWQE